jgi:hypothetical protein
VSIRPIADFLTADHRRLDALLDVASVEATIVHDAFGAFRAGILRHIGIEEKILLPAVREARGGTPLPIASRLKLDHSAIALLLVPTPRPDIVNALRSILGPHNEVEEAPSGFYANCDDLLADRANALLDSMRAYPDVPLAPYQDSDRVERMIRDAIRRTQDARSIG